MILKVVVNQIDFFANGIDGNIADLTQFFAADVIVTGSNLLQKRFSQFVKHIFFLLNSIIKDFQESCMIKGG